MKKLKLLAGLSTLGVLGGGVALSATGCTWTYKGGDSKLDPKLEINIEDATVSVGASNSLTVTIKYDGNEDSIAEIKAESSDKSIFIVESIDKETGQVKIKGLASGTAKLTITVTDTEGHVNKKVVEITVKGDQDEYRFEILNADNHIVNKYWDGYGGGSVYIFQLFHNDEYIEGQANNLSFEFAQSQTGLTKADFKLREIGKFEDKVYRLDVERSEPDWRELKAGTDKIKITWDCPSGEKIVAVPEAEITIVDYIPVITSKERVVIPKYEGAIKRQHLGAFVLMHDGVKTTLQKDQEIAYWIRAKEESSLPTGLSGEDLEYKYNEKTEEYDVYLKTLTEDRLSELNTGTDIIHAGWVIWAAPETDIGTNSDDTFSVQIVDRL